MAPLFLYILSNRNLYNNDNDPCIMNASQSVVTFDCSYKKNDNHCRNIK